MAKRILRTAVLTGCTASLLSGPLLPGAAGAWLPEGRCWKTPCAGKYRCGADGNCWSPGTEPPAQVGVSCISWPGISYCSGAIVTNVIYFPLKVTGALLFGIPWTMTATAVGNPKDARSIFCEMVAGEYWITPTMVANWHGWMAYMDGKCDCRLHFGGDCCLRECRGAFVTCAANCQGQATNECKDRCADERDQCLQTCD